MVLVITFKEDFTADYVINLLNKREIPYKRLNCEDLLLSSYSFQFSESYFYSLMGVNRFDAVWFRRTKLPELTNLSIPEKLYLSNEIEAFIKNIFCVIDAKWVSDPFAVYKAENKFLQLKEASKLGFALPDTLITNSKDELKSFYNDHNKNIIIKPMAQTRINYSGNPQFIFTNKVTDISIDQIDNYDLTPCIFQENISKEYEIRVTVVGKDVFPAAIYSQDNPETMTDWRRKKMQFYQIELPTDIKEKCICLLEVLQLKFGAIDLIKDKSGNYIFLEINPNGQWAWIESQTNMPIARAIIEQLL